MVNILNVPIYDKDLNSASALIIDLCKGNKKENLCISARDANGLVIAKKDSHFRVLLNEFFLNLPDGMPCVWLGRIKGARNIGRCYGPDLFAKIIQNTRDSNIKHFLCGGKNGVAEDLQNVCENVFENKNIAGIFTPPFRAMENIEIENLAKAINDKQVDIVWIGISTPKQEILARELSRQTNVKFLIAVGAAFDFHTGRVIQAPRFVQRMGMEWFFRLCMEPKRLFKRYAEVVPLFLYYNFKELISR